MLGDTDEPWRLPALKRLASEFGELERVRGGRPARSRPPRRRLAGLVAPPAVVAAALAVLFALQSGPAGALSIINQAPAAAARSTYVRFSSGISLTRNGRELIGFSQTGQIDFAHGDYRTSLSIAQADATIEWLTVGGVLYLSTRHQPQRGSSRIQRLAFRLTPAQRRKLASAPESDAITDPLAVLRLLANTRAPVKRVGSATLDGVPTTRYRLATDLAAILRASSSGGRGHAAYRRVDAVLDVWLDKQGRPRRVKETLTGPASEGAIELRTTIRFSGYGSPVGIQAPAGVTPEPTLAGGLPKLLTGTPSHAFERLLGASPKGP